jgi:hypothetical protein
MANSSKRLNDPAQLFGTFDQRTQDSQGGNQPAKKTSRYKDSVIWFLPLALLGQSAVFRRQVASANSQV